MKKYILVILLIVGAASAGGQLRLLPGVQAASDLMRKGDDAGALHKANEQLKAFASFPASVTLIPQVRELLYGVYLTAHYDDATRFVVDEVGTRIVVLSKKLHALVKENPGYAHNYAFDLGVQLAKIGNDIGAQQFVHFMDVMQTRPENVPYAVYFLYFMVQQFDTPRAAVKLLHLFALHKRYKEFLGISQNFDVDILDQLPPDCKQEYRILISGMYSFLSKQHEFPPALVAEIESKYVKVVGWQAIDRNDEDCSSIGQQLPLIMNLTQQKDNIPANIEASMIFLKACIASGRYDQALQCASNALQALRTWEGRSAWRLYDGYNKSLAYFYNYLALYKRYKKGFLNMSSVSSKQAATFKDPIEAMQALVHGSQEFKKTLKTLSSAAKQQEAERTEAERAEKYSEQWFSEVD